MFSFSYEIIESYDKIVLYESRFCIVERRKNPSFYSRGKKLNCAIGILIAAVI